MPGRDDDTFGVGFVYSDIDGGVFTSLGLIDDAYGFEAFYNFALGSGMGLTFDAQVIDPIIDLVDTTTILGARLNIRF